MAAEVNNMIGGWPLGLESLIIRLRATEGLRSSVTASPSPFHMRSDSFLSYSSSSELDTESTTSFFRDHSITLGRLIGINPGDGDPYFTNLILPEELESTPMVSAPLDAMERREAQSSCCKCIPFR